MRILIFRLLILIMIMSSYSKLSFGHGTEHLFWTTINSTINQDFENKSLMVEANTNTVFGFFNGGLSYKYTSVLDKKHHANLYLGLGLLMLSQFQVGFSNDGYSIKYRTDIPNGILFKEFSKKHIEFGFITWSFTAEKYFNNKNMNWFIGVGVGYSINHFFGKSYFCVF